MDRFKFRVWSVEEKSYDHKFPFNSLGIFYIAETGRLFSDFGNTVAPEMHEDRFVVEQCTGLKDKNGNLIYEGDIIHEVDKEADIDDVSQIVWNQGTCHFMKLDLPETGLDRHCILCEDDSLYLEIIGNIHEQKDKE